MAESKTNIKGNVLKNSTYNLLGNIVLRIFQIIQSFFMANILGPTQYGLRNGIQMYFEYGNYNHLGTNSLLSKKRQLYEHSNVVERDYLTNLVFSFNLITGIIFILISLGLYFILTDITLKYSLLLIGFCVFIANFRNINNIILNSQQKFKQISKINFWIGLSGTIFICLGVYFFGIIGSYLGSILYLTINYFLSKHYAGISFKFIFEPKKYFELIKNGFILFLLSFSFLLIFSINRLFIIKGYGITELGYYAIGLFFANLMYFFITTLVYPLIPNIYQNRDNNVDLIKYIIIPYRLVMSLIYFMCILIIFLIPFIIFILPEYNAGIQYINILLFSIIFFPILITNYFISRNQEMKLLFITSIIIILEVLSNIFILLLNLKPIYLAISVVIINFIYGFILNLICYKDIFKSYKKALKEIFNYLWPLGYALVGYGLLWLLAHYVLYGFVNYYLVKIIQAILFTIWYSPILWKIEKEHKILKIIWTGVKNKLSKQPLEKNIE